ncbi:Ras GTPase-activating protein 1 [Borealophlyctis nickersoniae]|nr:Ras GTPase-activating protein 1 [Borealophlyctis nickersoniae]
MSQRAYREDHRLRFKVVEAKNLSLQSARIAESAESYCIVGIQRKLAAVETFSSDPSLGNLATQPHSYGSQHVRGTATPHRISTAESGGGAGLGGRLSISSVNELRRMSMQGTGPGSLMSGSRRGSTAVATDQGRRMSGVSGIGSGSVGVVRTKGVVGATPFWGEEWDFELDDTFHAVIVQLHKKTILAKDPVIGRLLLPAVALESDNRPHEDWFAIQTEEDSAAGAWGAARVAVRCDMCELACHKAGGCVEQVPANCGSVGSIRIWYFYTREPILPLRHYGRLKDIILDSTQTALRVFARVCDDKEGAAFDILQICRCAPGEAASQFVSALCEKEIAECKDPATLFRGNSMATKSLDVYMKLIGLDFLREVLQSFVKDVIKSNKDCEIDPMKLEAGDDAGVRDSHIAMLEGYISTVMASIISHARSCPRGLRLAFTTIRLAAAETFPNAPSTQYTAVTAFLFLRFFTAAILGPKLFCLTDELPPPRATRTFTLVSKALQQAANLSEFDGAKEPWSVRLNPCVRKCVEDVKTIVDIITGEAGRKKRQKRGTTTAMRIRKVSDGIVRRVSKGGTLKRASSASGSQTLKEPAINESPPSNLKPASKWWCSICCGGRDSDVAPAPTPLVATKSASIAWSEEALEHSDLKPPASTDSTPHIDVERHLAAVQRHFIRVIDHLLPATETDGERLAVTALIDAIKDIESLGNSEERQRMRLEQLERVGAVVVGTPNSDGILNKSDDELSFGRPMSGISVASGSVGLPPPAPAERRLSMFDRPMSTVAGLEALPEAGMGPNLTEWFKQPVPVAKILDTPKEDVVESPTLNTVDLGEIAVTAFGPIVDDEGVELLYFCKPKKGPAMVCRKVSAGSVKIKGVEKSDVNGLAMPIAESENLDKDVVGEDVDIKIDLRDLTGPGPTQSVASCPHNPRSHAASRSAPHPFQQPTYQQAACVASEYPTKQYHNALMAHWKAVMGRGPIILAVSLNLPSGEFAQLPIFQNEDPYNAVLDFCAARSLTSHVPVIYNAVYRELCSVFGNRGGES